MCLKTLLKLFSKSSTSDETATSGTTEAKIGESTNAAETATNGLSLLHPEEAMDETQTVENTDIYTVMTEWLREWSVPSEYWKYWRMAIVIELYDSWPAEYLKTLNADTPACTWDSGVRHLASLAKWFNPGVIAHEQAHNSYALLTDAQKAEFALVYTPLKDTDPLIKYLYSINTYGLTTVVEGHAEVYRYLGQSMPESLKRFYPRLF